MCKHVQHSSAEFQWATTTRNITNKIAQIRSEIEIEINSIAKLSECCFVLQTKMMICRRCSNTRTNQARSLITSCLIWGFFFRAKNPKYVPKMIIKWSGRTARNRLTLHSIRRYFLLHLVSFSRRVYFGVLHSILTFLQLFRITNMQFLFVFILYSPDSCILLSGAHISQCVPSAVIKYLHATFAFVCN